MRLVVKDPSALRLILQSLSRFVRKGHVEASNSGLRVQSIDAHDFCYSDLILGKEFFESYKANGTIVLELDFSRIFRITPHLASGESLELDLDSDGLRITTSTSGISTFKIAPSLTGSFPFDRLHRARFDATVTVDALEFMGEIRKAAAISHEITFRDCGDGLELMAQSGDYQFYAIAAGTAKVERKKAAKDAVSSSIIVDYVRQLGPLIEKADSVTVNLARDAPLQLEFSINGWGRFCFYLSHRKLDGVQTGTKVSTGESLPRVSMTRFPDYCLFLSDRRLPIAPKHLVLSQVETDGGDYTRLAKRLGFVTSYRNRLKLTTKGRKWTGQYVDDPDRAKKSLHNSALHSVQPYRKMVELLLRRPMTQEEILGVLNTKSRVRGKRDLDRQDISTLLGIATWSGAVDRSMGLYYFGRESQ